MFLPSWPQKVGRVSFIQQRETETNIRREVKGNSSMLLSEEKQGKIR